MMTRRGAGVPRDTDSQHEKAQEPRTKRRQIPEVAYRRATARSGRAESVGPVYTGGGIADPEPGSLIKDAKG